MEQLELAIHGGLKTKQTPFGSGKRFGQEELKELTEALEQNTLFYHSGQKTKKFLADFNQLYGVKYSVATSSGSAAIHVALGAAGISVGDEVITSPITDQGTIIGILFQNAIPVFADVDPHTYNMDARSIESNITPRTKAILVVHLAGGPCDMKPIMEIARKHNLIVIEDCAQSYMSYYNGQLLGTIGHYGCFSTNDYKHISTGDGGIVVINSDDVTDYQRAHAFADKNYTRFENAVVRDAAYIAPNYRMTELQAAVGIAQLKKLPWICETRGRYGTQLTLGIEGLPGILPHRIVPGGESSYWFYLMRIDEEQLGCTRDQFSQALHEEGIPNTLGYIPSVIYMTSIFQNRQAYRNSHFPFELSDANYSQGICPVAEKVLKTSIRLSINEFYTREDIQDMILAIRKVALFYSKKNRDIKNHVDSSN